MSRYLRFAFIFLFTTFLSTLSGFNSFGQTLLSQFTANPTGGQGPPFTVFFTDESINPDTWFWDFGDGDVSTAQNPIHTYTTPGIFSAKLTISDTTFGGTSISPILEIRVFVDAYDISIALYAGDGERFSIAAQETSPFSLAFNGDGTKMYIMGILGDDINEYTLGSPYDVSTAVYAGDGERFSVAAQETTPFSLAFNGDDTKMYVMGTFGADINEYTLGSAYDVSTAVYAGDGERFSVTAQERAPRSLAFNGDGTKMYVIGGAGLNINENTLGSAYDVSTAVYAGDGERFSVAAQETNPFSLAFNGDGTKMYVLGGDGDDINEYTLGSPYDVSTAVYAGDGERFSVAAQETSPTSLAFNGDGTKMYVMGFGGINEYSLAEPVVRGAVANQAVNDLATISPFATITVADPNGDNVSATITLDDNIKGVLTGTGLTGTGPYNLVSTDPTSLQAGLRALVFNPTDNRVALGNTETTTFTLVASDGTLSDTDSRTTVVSSPVAPTVTLSSTATSPTNAFTLTATFSEAVTGFELTDFIIGNGTASDFNAISTTVYAVLITPDTDGQVTIDIAAGVAQDNGGVDNSAATQFSIQADVSSPSVVITSSQSSPTNSNPIPVTLTFSEEVTGFGVGGLTVGNGTAGNFATADNIVFTADITPATDGNVTIDIAATIAQDLAGNDNEAATQFSILYDGSDPTVVITSTATSPTNSNPIPITLTFSEEVTGFATGDLTVGNGTAGNFATADNIVFTADITPTADGNVTVDIASTIAQDLVGNDNVAATQFSILYDNTDPTVVIASTETSPTNSNPIPVTLTFSEEVAGFTVGDLTVGNGTAGNFATADNIVFTADITPTADGNVTVDIASTIAQDLVGNDNEAATQFSILYDNTDPTVVIASTEISPTNSNPIPVTLTFSEEVTGFAVGDLTVGNGTAGNFATADNIVFTADITPTADGNVTIDIAATIAQDLAGNDNVAATQFSILYDGSDPTVVIASTETSPINSNPIPVTLTFSEEVTGFALGDLTVGNGTAGNFSTADNIAFTADITPTADGNVTIDITSTLAQDLAGNGNEAATQFSILYDGTDPTVMIASTETSPTNSNPIPVTLTFSEEVTGFAAGDLTVSNGTAVNFTTADNIVFTADITPAADGNVTIGIAAAIAQDLAGNDNVAATQFSILYDGSDPTVVLTSTATSPSNSNPIPVTLTFSEEVTGFTVGDLAVGNGTADNFATADNIVFTADITPAADGNVTIDITAAIAQDLAGNDNEAATQFSIIYDGSIDQVNCQDITVQLDASGTATIEAAQIDNGSSDDFGIAARAIDINTFGCDDIGDNTITLTITDNNGNTETCLAVVTVEDTIAPIVITQDITVALDVNGQASITPADIDNGSTDNCGIASMTLDITTFDTPTTTSTTVILTVTDVNGNSSTNTAVVTFGKVSQIIVFAPLVDKKVGEDPVLLQATGGDSGLSVTFSISTEPASGVASLMDNTIIIEGLGMVAVTASQAGNDVFEAAEGVSQSFEILANELFLPTLFTPNGDLTNDRFIVRGGGNIATIELKIFDRDNNMVFSSNSLEELFQVGWGGGEQPQGAYIWVINGSFADGTPLLVNGKDTGIIRLAR